MFRTLLNRVLNSQFNRNVIILTVGTAISQALPILFYPILARVYTVEQLGAIATFSTWAYILANVAGGKYELAILLPKSESESRKILVLGIVLTLFFGIVAQIFLFFDAKQVARLMGLEQMYRWLLWLPAVFVAISLFEFYIQCFVRRKEFRQIAFLRIVRGSTTAIVQVILGFIRVALGLVLGVLLGYLAGLLLAIKALFRRKGRGDSRITLKELYKIAKRYRKFPFYNVPSILSNRLSLEMPNVLVPYFFGISFLGYYSAAYKFINIPVYFISKSLGQVYLKEVAIEMHESGTVHRTFFSVLGKLLLLSLPVFVVIFFIVPYVFDLLFEPQWAVAAQYAQIITPFVFLRFVVSPLTQTLYILERQEFILIINVMLLTASATSFIVGHWLGWDFKSTLILHSFAMLSAYLLGFIVVLYWVLYFKKHPKI